MPALVSAIALPKPSISDPPGLEQVRNSPDARERAQPEEDSRIHCRREDRRLAARRGRQALRVHHDEHGVCLRRQHRGPARHTRQLAAPFDPRIANPGQMDRWTPTLPQLGNHGDASDRRGNEHPLCHDVRKAERQQPEHRAQQHALDPRREHARRQAAAGAHRGQCRQRRRRDRERLHDAVPEDARRAWDC